MLRILGSPQRLCTGVTRREMLRAGGLSLFGLGLSNFFALCDRLPRTAKVMDRVTVLRSLTHPYPLHGVAFATTGCPAIDVPMELNPRDGRHQPFIGSIVDYLSRGRKKPADAPDNIALP